MPGISSRSLSPEEIKQKYFVDDKGFCRSANASRSKLVDSESGSCTALRGANLTQAIKNKAVISTDTYQKQQANKFYVYASGERQGQVANLFGDEFEEAFKKGQIIKKRTYDARCLTKKKRLSPKTGGVSKGDKFAKFSRSAGKKKAPPKGSKKPVTAGKSQSQKKPALVVQPSEVQAVVLRGDARAAALLLMLGGRVFHAVRVDPSAMPLQHFGQANNMFTQAAGSRSGADGSPSPSSNMSL
jgi:hypothetical protein